MRLPDWDRTIQALVLIRMGQELGTDSKLARAIHALAEITINLFR
jgi:hypothetical protein